MISVRCPIPALVLALASFGCGGVSTRHVGVDGDSAADQPATGLVVAGELRLLAARRDGSLIAYADQDHVAWAVRPGEEPEQIIRFLDDEISATFARDADALVLRGNLGEPHLVYWLPGEGPWLIGPSDYTGSISYGGAVLYGDRKQKHMALFRPHYSAAPLGEAAGWPLTQLNGRFGVVATRDGLVALDVEQVEPYSELLALDDTSRVALAPEGPVVAFLGDGTPPPDGSAPGCCSLHVHDLATKSRRYEEPAGVEFFQAGGGAVFYYGSAGQSDLRRVHLDGTPPVHFGSGPVVEWFGASDDGNRIVIREEPVGDSEVPVVVQELGGNRVMRRTISRVAPVFLRHGGEVLVSGIGTAEPPYDLALTGGGRDTDDAFPDQRVSSSAPLLDDQDGILFDVAGPDGSTELWVGNVMTLAQARVGRSVGHRIQVAGRRLAAEVRDGPAVGLYLLPIPAL